ncbi:hypothetical protein [Aureimonas sp. AU40]|uniref:hypothetical protein n=1 Tax=Aureimonas sp. AU40 TaxID=1637747 RepID=UPI000783E8F6|nr:hypothetical protein [Aureimonas sp. AU40]
MQIFPENYVVTYDVPLHDLNDKPVEVTGASVSVTDERRRPLGAIDAVLGETLRVVVPAELNALQAGTSGMEGRVVTVVLHTPGGDITRQLVYAVQGTDSLAVPNNSFQTIHEARIKAFDLPGLKMVHGASDRDLRAALIEAYARLTRISLKIIDSYDRETLILPEVNYRTRFTYIDQQHWHEMDVATFDDFPAYFTDRLKRAQIIEADEILTGDIIGDKRRAGVLSESIGESSMMFRNGVLDMGVTRAALEALTGLVHYQFRITR